MSFDNIGDIQKINATPLAERGLPTTIHEMLARTKANHGNRKAVSYQITSGPKDKAETITWSEFYEKSVQAANLFRLK